MEPQLEGVYYVVRAEAISRQLPVVRGSWNTETVLVQTQLSVVQFQESTSCEQCSVKEELPAQNLQCDIRRLAFVCYQTRNCVLYLLCVISAIVAINSLVKSGESTFIVVALPSRKVSYEEIFDFVKFKWLWRTQLRFLKGTTKTLVWKDLGDSYVRKICCSQ
jgi:hypothetical protein